MTPYSVLWLGAFCLVLSAILWERKFIEEDNGDNDNENSNKEKLDYMQIAIGHAKCLHVY